MTDTAAARQAAHNTTFAVLFAISFCHLLNDMMQSLLPAIYPSLKTNFHLSFTQVGLITLVYQITASLLQPAVGYVSDLRPRPYSLATGMVSTLIGLLLLSVAGHYGVILLAAMLIGVGSAVFHPEVQPRGAHGLRRPARSWPSRCFRWAAIPDRRWARFWRRPWWRVTASTASPGRH